MSVAHLQVIRCLFSLLQSQILNIPPLISCAGEDNFFDWSLSWVKKLRFTKSEVGLGFQRRRVDMFVLIYVISRMIATRSLCVVSR